ncbi:MAG: flagellar biosynthetic protein FliO [Planctomycetes bacterium]|nr:flagellar biosynthetic protein FliO [Planctomycetota bacterium]MCD7895650.1 flagellar biosynthetic protein FliO [Planctomycetaceae bacterium]
MGLQRFGIITFFLIVLQGSGLLAGDMIAGKGFPVGAAAIPPKSTISTTVVRPAAGTTAPTPLNLSDTGQAPASGAVQTTVVPTDTVFENQPLAFPSDTRRPSRPDQERRGYSMPSIWPMLFAVAVVCGFFCTALWLVKKYVPGHKQLFNHPAIEVLGRTHLDQRRYVSLLRVGKRIVVVGVSPDEIRSLTEITEEAEVTGILEIARPKTEAGLSIFQRLFQKNMVKAEAEETRALADAEADQLTEQMAKLREQVERIKKTGTGAAARRTSAKAAARAAHVDTLG